MQWFVWTCIMIIMDVISVYTDTINPLSEMRTHNIFFSQKIQANTDLETIFTVHVSSLQELVLQLQFCTLILQFLFHEHLMWDLENILWKRSILYRKKYHKTSPNLSNIWQSSVVIDTYLVVIILLLKIIFIYLKLVK